ncbi:DnaD domain protein [Chloroflexota bacterium]
MKRTWIKLYVEIIQDPKMGQLPNWLWRRAIEFFMIAGEFGEKGLLRPIPDMAWRLRIGEDDLSKSLEALSEVGVVTETPDGWKVTHFEKRQAPPSSTERVRKFRQRKKEGQNTNDLRNVNETDSETHLKQLPSSSASSSSSLSVSGSSSSSASSSDSDNADVFDFSREKSRKNLKAQEVFEVNIGSLSPMQMSLVKELVDEYTDAWVCDALLEAVKSDVPKLKYVEAILKRWVVEGIPPAKMVYTAIVRDSLNEDEYIESID